MRALRGHEKKRLLYEEKCTPKVGWIYSIFGSFFIGMSTLVTITWILGQTMLINELKKIDNTPKLHYLFYTISLGLTFIVCYLICKWMFSYRNKLKGLPFDFLVVGSDLAKFLAGLFTFTYGVIAVLILTGFF